MLRSRNLISVPKKTSHILLLIPKPERIPCCSRYHAKVFMNYLPRDERNDVGCGIALDCTSNFPLQDSHGARKSVSCHMLRIL